MNQSRRYSATEVYSENYYQLPKVLFTNDRYKKISNDAKVAYALLKDRFNFSVKNHWIDEENNIYFIFTNAELMTILQVGNKKVIRIKNELISAGLLDQQRMGLNKPNRLYLLRPEVNATDVYLQINAQTLGTSGSVKMTLPEGTPQTLGTSGSVKMTLPKNDTQTLGTSGSVKMTHNQYKEQLDTNKDTKLDTQKLDFSTAHFSSAEIEKQNHDLVQNADQFLTDPNTEQIFLEPEAVRLLSYWCRTPQQMRRFIQIILNAKYNVEKEHRDLKVYIDLDDPILKPLMTKTLRRYFNVLRSNEKHVKNVENYLYGTMQNLFGVYWNKKAHEKYLEEHPEAARRQHNVSEWL